MIEIRALGDDPYLGEAFMAHADRADEPRGTGWTESDLLLAFAASVRLRRRYSDVTQEGLGLATGLHRNYVGAIERAEVNPTLLTIARVSAGLGMPMAALMAQAESMVRDPATVARLRTKRVNRRRRVSRSSRSASPSARRKSSRSDGSTNAT